VDAVSGFVQNYTPAGSASALLALLPALLILLMMCLSRLPMWKITLAGFGLTLLLAVAVWDMPPAAAASAAAFGAANALFPMIWTLGCAMWLFQLLSVSGYLEALKAFLQGITPDRRLQALLIGTAFTAFLESIAAFGAPIAIAGAMLIGLGFPAETALTVALLSDMVPGPWGTQSMPLTTLESVSGTSAALVGPWAAVTTAPLSVLVACGVVAAVSGRRGLREIWYLPLGLGLAYAVLTGAIAAGASVSAAGVAAGMLSILMVIIAARMRRRKTPWRFPGERRPERTVCRRGAALRAVFPYLALVILALAVGMEPLRSSLKTAGQLRLIWPGLEVFRMPPVSAQQESYPAVYSVNVLSNGGSLVFLACLLSIPVLKLKPAGVWEALKRAARQLLFPGVTLLCVLAMAYVMNYAGMTLSIGLPLMKLNGSLFSDVTVIVGVLGCVLTGSVAGSNALFGNLIATVGASVKCNSAAVLAALCGGGALGKLITPQNLAIAGSQLNEAQRREWMPRITKRMFAWALAGLLLELIWVCLLQRGIVKI
jgi:lactate permease